MDDPAPLDPAPRRWRSGLFPLLILLAVAVGLALMWAATREGGGWWPRTGDAPSAATGTSGATSPVPPALPAAGATDPVTLATRESALAAQLAALEARAATIGGDIAASSDRAGRAEAILVAVAARRSIERGAPLGYLEDQLRQRFGATHLAAVDTVIAAGRDPVTIIALRQALEANASLLLNPGSDGWFSGLVDELRRLVIIHDANTPSPLPAERLARARRMLDAGQVEPAVEEISRLPGGAQVGKWTAAARRYIAAHRALDTLETAAIVGTIPPSPTLAPPAPAAEAPATPTADQPAAP